MPTATQVARTTAEAYAKVIPDEALRPGDPRYVPLDIARGTRNVAQVLTDRIVALDDASIEGGPRDWARFLVTGHRGCGKTTELYRLKELLVQANFAVVYFDVESELNLQDLNWWNVLLEMIWQIDEQLSQPPHEIQIPETLRNGAAEWLARAVTEKTERTDMEASLETELGVGAGLSFFAKARAAVKALVKTGASTVKKIEQEVERRPSVLREAVSGIVTHVQDALGSRGTRGLIIIADGLEKIPPRSLGNGLTTHNTLFIHNSIHLKAPPCHLIYAFPLELLTSANVGQAFPERPMLMPMVRVRHKDGREDNRGLRLMSEIIKRRVDRTLLAPGVVRTLALASGGHIRDFLHLFREAASGFGNRVTARDAKRAVANLTEFYDLTIQQEFLDSLCHVAQHASLPGSPYDGELVYRLLVLLYHNDEAWNAVHPCVQAAPRFARCARAQDEGLT